MEETGKVHVETKEGAIDIINVLIDEFNINKNELDL